MTADEGGGEDEGARWPRVDPRIDRIEFVSEGDSDDLTIDGSASHTIPQPDSETTDAEDELLRRVERLTDADRLRAVRLPGIYRINAYYLDTDPADLAETVARLDRRLPTDGITTVAVGDHAVVRLTYRCEDDADGAEEDGDTALYWPTGDDALDDALVNGGSE